MDHCAGPSFFVFNSSQLPPRTLDHPPRLLHDLLDLLLVLLLNPPRIKCTASDGKVGDPLRTLHVLTLLLDDGSLVKHCTNKVSPSHCDWV